MKIIHLAIIVCVCVATIIGIYTIWFFTSSYDFSTYTKDNPLGIQANVIYNFNPYLMCPQLPCHASNTFQLNFTSKEGSELIAYNICDGMFCIKKEGFENHIISVHPKIAGINFGEASAYQSGPVMLGNVTWKVNDTVNIRIKAIPVTLLDNGSLIYYPENMMLVDLGESKIVEVGNPTK